MNKIYIGNTEVANTGGGGTIDTSGFVDVSTWDEHEKVIASALVDLKSLESKIEEFDDKIEGHVEVIDTQIQTLNANKADSSVVYTKKEIDKSDKVVAAALAELNDRVSTLENSSGGGSSFDPTDINSSISDISTRVDNVSTRVQTLESNCLDSDDISTFIDIDDVSAFTYSKAHIDASFAAIPSSGGEGSFDPTDINSSISDISTRVGTIEINYLDSDDISTFKPIVYTDLSTYENNVSEGTIDQNTMYVITDLADSDELSTLVTVDDLASYKQDILDDVSTTANTTIANANSSINLIKNSAISAVLSQQTTSVNAVNTAKNNANTSIGNAKTSALSDISTFAAEKIASMPTFVVMTESDYNQITPNSSTLYFLT